MLPCYSPDFRSPGTGLYDNLQKYNLPSPTDVFSLDFFRTSHRQQRVSLLTPAVWVVFAAGKRPEPFYMLAKELFPGKYCPTLAHSFLRLLHQRQVLLRCFSQNIDSLETEAGLPHDKLVQAHGSFDAAHCIDCMKEHSIEYVKQFVFESEQAAAPAAAASTATAAADAKSAPAAVATTTTSPAPAAADGKSQPTAPKAVPRCKSCGGLVKPDIVFFGENLPER